MRATRCKRWRAIVVGFIAVMSGGFHSKGWSEDLPPPAVSTPTPALEQRLDRLDQQIRALQRQLDTNQSAQTKNTNLFAIPGQPASSQNPPAGEATAGRSGFALQSTDGNYVLRFQGLVQADGRFYTGDGANARHYSAATAGTVAADQFLLRRVRPILSGSLFHIYDFFIQPDFGGGVTAIYDAYLDIRPWTAANLRVGKFKTPLGLERLQTDSYLTFPERSLTADLTPQRDTGLELFGAFAGNALTYQASLTNGVQDGGYTPDSDANNAKEGTLRIFARPFQHSSTPGLTGLGVGVAGGYAANNSTGSGLPAYRTAAGQEQFFIYASGVAFDGQRSHIVPQANYYAGPLGVYGEYVQDAQAARVGALSSRLTNTAWQGAASWVLTGENASYVGVAPDKPFDPRARTWGAFELAARVHQLQIDPDTFRLGYAAPSISASRATAYTLGLNWYLNKFVKFYVDYEETWFKGGAGTAASVSDRPIERVIDTRWQVAF